MTPLTADYEDNRQDGHIIYYKIKTDENIYKGALVVTDVANGYLYAGTAATSRIFAGVAVERSLAADVDTDSDGLRGVRVFRNGVFQIPAVGATQAWVGRQMTLVDDNTVGLQAPNYIVVGICVGYVSDTKVKVDICCPGMGQWTEESWSSSSSSSSSSSNSSSSSSTG